MYDKKILDALHRGRGDLDKMITLLGRADERSELLMAAFIKLHKQWIALHSNPPDAEKKAIALINHCLTFEVSLSNMVPRYKVKRNGVSHEVIMEAYLKYWRLMNSNIQPHKDLWPSIIGALTTLGKYSDDKPIKDKTLLALIR